VTPREQEEYSALRATIRERGTARVWAFVAGLATWAGFVLALLATALPPVATLIPLVALAATFEAVLALHVGVERIGRFLLVFHADAWEQAAGTFGRPRGAAAVDPLFVWVFLTAAVVNLLPLLTATPIAPEWIVVGGAHAGFVVRLAIARGAAARQRQVDTARFEQLKTQARSSPSDNRATVD
jgi:hypothetical protein